jgi:hypothetical protein
MLGVSKVENFDIGIQTERSAVNALYPQLDLGHFEIAIGIID